jgi:ferredoxin--NADP+ reductase
MMAHEYNATLIGRTMVAPGLIGIRVAPDHLPFEFKPGQYVVLGLKATEGRVAEADDEESGGVPTDRTAAEAADPDRTIRRSYCIASDSRADRYLDFHVTLIPSGEFTPRLFNLKVGDRLYMSAGAEGHFTLDRSQGKHILMVATGAGLAPYLSMIREELVLHINGRLGVRALVQRNSSRHFALVHGARRSWDLGFRAELAGLARNCANFHYVPAITRPEEDETWRGPRGYVQEVVASGTVEKLTGLAITPENFDIFLCGHPGMVESMIDWAQARGFARDNAHTPGTLHVEKYW